jgi:hypothetical protein
MRLRIDPRLLAAIAVALVVVGLYALAVSAASRFAESDLPEATTFSSAPEGLKAFYRYLDELGLEPKTLQQFDTLPEGVTIVIAANQAFSKPVRPEETERLAEWVRAGGRVVLAGTGASEFVDPLGVGSGTALTDDVELRPVLPSVYVQGVKTVRPGRSRIYNADSGWAVVLKDGDGVALGVRRVGAGEVVWLADAYPITNEGIAEADNARLGVLLAAVGGREIWFDEYHHGFARGGGVIERIGPGGQSALALFALGLALLLAAYSRRPRSPRRRPRERWRTSIRSPRSTARRVPAGRRSSRSKKGSRARSHAGTGRR